MKRVLIVAALVIVAAIAGVVRSHTHISRNGIQFSASPGQESAGEVRDEVRKSYDLSPGAQVEISGINGAVNVETADVKTAEVYIVRTAKDQSALERRKIVIENSPDRLTIRGEKGDVGFFDHLFGSSPSERVTLKVPPQISLLTKGVNGAVTIGDLDGSVEIHGVNGRVQVGQATGSAEFHGINGNITVALKELNKSGVEIGGINGNIELRLAESVNADLDAHGMNGSVRSDVPGLMIDKDERGRRFSAHIGSGGNPIEIKGVNGNVRLTRLVALTTASAPVAPAPPAPAAK